MKNLTIIYGYCNENRKAITLERLRHSNAVLKAKSIGGLGNHVVFAVLLDSHVTHIHTNFTDIDFIQIPIPDKRRNICSPAPGALRLSRKKFEKARLSSEQREAYQQANRAYRKYKNQYLTADNWRQHINKKAAMNEVESVLLARQSSSRRPTFFLTKSQMPTPFSLASSLY